VSSDIGAFGINDYWFLDGYRRVREARGNNRLENLDEIFPVIEISSGGLPVTANAIWRGQPSSYGAQQVQPIQAHRLSSKARSIPAIRIESARESLEYVRSHEELLPSRRLYVASERFGLEHTSE
jgi:hypothetical protein